MSAEDQPQRPRSPASARWNQRRPLAANLLRLVLRAHRRAPGKILAAREDFTEL